MFIPMSSLKFTVQLKGEVSASKVPFILSLKPTRTKRTYILLGKILKIMKVFTMKHLFMNKYQQKSMSLTRLRKKKLKRALRKENKKEERLLKIMNFKKKKKQQENKKNEKELWNQLKELNQEFKDIKEHKKTLKKCQKRYLRRKYFFVGLILLQSIFNHR